MFLAIEFSRERITFSILFIIAFLGIMIFSYVKDFKNNKKYYSKSGWWVAVAIVTIIGLLFLSKYLVKTYSM